MAEFMQWIADLDATFAFLLALPFVVAAVALLAEHLRTRSDETAHAGIRTSALRVSSPELSRV